MHSQMRTWTLITVLTLTESANKAQHGELVNSADRDNYDINVRRYMQLADMMNFFNPNFDEKKYWAYGCNCLIIGDRPMTTGGYGPPLDALDGVCKKYKDCVQCAHKEFGEQCFGEIVRYRFKMEDHNVQCLNDQNSCERSLCECDRAFAQDHVNTKDAFNEDWHLFWSTLPGGFEPKDDCQSGGHGSTSHPECCRNPSGTSSIYNPNMSQCCDGHIIPLLGRAVAGRTSGLERKCDPQT